MRVKPIRAELDINGDSLMGAYSSFVGSPASNGVLQFDMWNVEPSERYDWNALKESIKTHGLRLVASCTYANSFDIANSREQRML